MSIYLDSRPAILSRSDFAPQGTFGNILRHFGCHHWRGVLLAPSGWVEDRDAAGHPTTHRTVPREKNCYPAPKVSSAGVEKPWPGLNVLVYLVSLDSGSQT